MKIYEGKIGVRVGVVHTSVFIPCVLVLISVIMLAFTLPLYQSLYVPNCTRKAT